MTEKSKKDDGDGRRDESKHDRELIELLNELRVALPGVQVLFAFLLTVPFSQRFVAVSETQKNVYFAAFLFATIATALLIAPSAHHRLQFREQDKEHLLQTSNSLTIAGLACLAAAIVCVVFLITDVLFDAPVVITMTAVAGALYAVLWYIMPLLRRAKTRKQSS